MSHSFIKNRLLLRCVAYMLQPLLLCCGGLIWYVLGYSAYTGIVALLFTQVVLRVCEALFPYHENWNQSSNEIVSLIAISFLGFMLFYVVDAFYAKWLVQHLIQWKTHLTEFLNTSLWPDTLPLLVQVGLFYFANEFILYWLHRSFHRFKFMWRLSGHAFHHAFKNIHALNFLSSHPVEIFFLAIPALILNYLIGVPPHVIFGGGVLLLVNSSIIHANVKTNNRFLGWFITTSSQHHMHHSVNYAESNTNFSCNAIIWDRIFGTYKAGEVNETGISHNEIPLLDKFLLPIKEPSQVKNTPPN